MDHRIVYQTGKVLRMKKGDEFHVFDEKGKEQLVKIVELNKRKIVGKVIQSVKNDSESKLNVSLYQAIPKKPALFELIVQKATEIGVNEIFPLITQRTEKRRMSKFERMQLIAIEASEQSGRTHIPLIRHPVNLEDALPKMTNAYIGYEYDDGDFLSKYEKTMYKKKDIQIIIGPEGGFSEEEVDKAVKAGVHPFTLGKRILRTETASIAALSIVMLNYNEQ